MKLIEKTILLTGASSGIGRELARQLAQRGNRLLLVARRGELLADLIAELPPHLDGHLYFECDVSDHAQVQSVCAQVSAAGISIDVLLINAGASFSFDARRIDLESFRRLMDVNFFGAVHFIKYLLPQMIERRSGVIAVNGSLAGYRGVPSAAAYSSTKGALMNFIESLRIDLRKYRIQCTLISPGFVKTPMTAKRRTAMPFVISAEKAAHIIIHGLERRTTEIRFPWIVATVASLVRLLPDKLYAWMVQSRRINENRANESLAINLKEIDE
jgi:short-subunit dehydrogenase